MEKGREIIEVEPKYQKIEMIVRDKY